VLVQRTLSALKATERREGRLRASRARVSHDVLARDAIWTLDATALGRVGEARILGEVLRDPAPPKTLRSRIGPAATAAQVIELLEQAARERGGLPLALQTDNGPAYTSKELAAYLEAHRVVHLRSRVHTPTDNPSEEHGIGELKAESGLDADVRCASHEDLRARLAHARLCLDEGRLRASRGWRTAAEVDAALARADALVDRRTFHEACRRAVETAVLGPTTARARRAAERLAIWTTLETFGLARTRGPETAPRDAGPVVADSRAG
jgi:hypothetical protein